MCTNLSPLYVITSLVYSCILSYLYLCVFTSLVGSCLLNYLPLYVVSSSEDWFVPSYIPSSYFPYKLVFT